MEQTLNKTASIEDVLAKRPLIISGPCSAETEEQMIKTATLLAETGRVDMLRAGIWKPRTRPGSFEGIGVKGLPWLLQAKKLTGLPTAVEVATAKQVEDALSFDVDLLWLGARTTVNPFSVQEIADALQGANVPVLIKNPLNPVFPPEFPFSPPPRRTRLSRELPGIRGNYQGSESRGPLPEVCRVRRLP